MDAFSFLSQNTPLALVLAGVFGLCVGSFLNVVIHRTPLIMKREWRQECATFLSNEPDIHPKVKEHLSATVAKDTLVSLSFPPSRCPNCNHQIRAHENIPLISWLILLRGKCSGCGTPISIRYPLVELISALLSVLVIYTFGTTLAGVAALIYVWILITLTGIDFDTQLLPDRLVFPLGMMGLMINSQNTFTSLPSAVWGGLLGFLSFWSITKLYALITKKDGMGAGDFKLLGAIGAWLGVSMLPFLILVSAVLGSVVGVVLMKIHGESRAFAFGPYIAIAGVIALLWGQDIMGWYLGV